jgi:hypothetical protein
MGTEIHVSVAQQPLVGQRLLIIEASRSHSDTPLGKTPVDEWYTRRRDLYLTIYNTHERQTSMLPVAFEPAIPASERPRTHAWEGAATGISTGVLYREQNGRGRDVDHSPPSTAQVKNEWKWSVLPLYAFMAWIGATLSSLPLRKIKVKKVHPITCHESTEGQ